MTPMPRHERHVIQSLQNPKIKFIAQLNKPRARRKVEAIAETKPEAPAAEETAKKVTRPRVRKAAEEAAAPPKVEAEEKPSKPRATRAKPAEATESKPKTKKITE